AGLMA
ncbi:hypothetical protein MK338_04315, partial [Streptococcus vestibularis]